MFLKKPDLTAGSRPTLSQDESLLLVQDGVGLYEDKFKVASCQNGHAYLTSHRVCYVDNTDPRAHCWAVDLKDVERHEYQAGFLKSSPKITLLPKPIKRGLGSAVRPAVPQLPALQRITSTSSPTSRSTSPFRPGAASSPPSPLVVGTWVCPICSFSNPIPSNFDPTIATESYPLPPCLACGIAPPFALVLKAAVTANASRIPHRPAVPSSERDRADAGAGEPGEITCPRCTFRNHPWMHVCELCAAPLPTGRAAPRTRAWDDTLVRAESPGPEISGATLEEEHESPSVKLSFRKGGDKLFYERLKNAMIQRRWLLQLAPPIPRPDEGSSPTPGAGAGTASGSAPEPRTVVAGIAGLERRGLQTRRNNEAVLGTAFADLEALMASAKDIVALAERFAAERGADAGGPAASEALVSQSAAALGMVATKDLVGDSSTTLYISELARTLAEYAADDGRAILRRHGGTMSLVDFWALFNRSRNGVELVSPADFTKAAEAWVALGLPVRLRRFKSGLVVVQGRDASDDKTVAQITDWLRSLRALEPRDACPWDWSTYGRGVSAQQAATRFGWSLGVATEELEMAEERGAVCREEGVEGLQFWLNHLVDDVDVDDEEAAVAEVA